jgi:hypothetical protein
VYSGDVSGLDFMRPMLHHPKELHKLTDSGKTPSRRRIVGTKAIPQDSDISAIMSDLAEIKDGIAAIQYELIQIHKELRELDDGN